jgi:phage terminase large subunit-like protein
MTTTSPAWLTDDSPLPDPHGKGERAVQFIEKLRHHEGKFAGRHFKLRGWQERIVRRIYGDTDEDGRRIIRTVFILLPRGNGKTTLCGALSLLHLLGPEHEAAGQVIVAASDREQASIAFNAANRMVRQSATLTRVTDTTASLKKIVHPKSDSILKAISHEAYSKHGMAISALVADEIHAWPTRELWDVLTSSMGKRDTPLTIAITTAGVGVLGLAWELYEYAKRVAAGEVDDPSFLPIIFEAPQGCDWQDEAIWHQVNPALADGFRSLEEMRTAAKRAAEIPAQLEAFKRLYLNIWSDGAASPWLDMAIYDEGGAPQDLDAFAGQSCWIGVDLSSTEDLTAVVIAFALEGGGFAVFPFFFVPQETLRRRQERDQVPYVRWAEEGHVIATPGAVVDYSVVEAFIIDMAERFRVEEILIDRWNATGTINRLTAEGLPVIKFGQGFASMSAAVKELERAILSRGLRHGGHPVLRWNFKNVVIDQDAAGNVKFNKARSAEKIDGAVGAAMAVARAAAAQGIGSPYESERPEGFLVV